MVSSKSLHRKLKGFPIKKSPLTGAFFDFKWASLPTSLLCDFNMEVDTEEFIEIQKVIFPDDLVVVAVIHDPVFNGDRVVDCF